ncbi:MAG: putative toxin-antitoxin system toxin component, PIN family [Tepidisphaeraceae bacterium]|jgi:putative PIN family toxin of toxin-antitoxin system
MRDTVIEQIVLDTNVLVAGLRSKRGASHRLLRLVGTGRFEIHVSVALVLEYEEVLKRLSAELGLTVTDVDDVLDYLCGAARPHEISFLWRPFLRDPDDDMLLELAVEVGCAKIVSHNVRDFAGCESLGIRVVSPSVFLREIGETK